MTKIFLRFGIVKSFLTKTRPALSVSAPKSFAQPGSGNARCPNNDIALDPFFADFNASGFDSRSQNYSNNFNAQISQMLFRVFESSGENVFKTLPPSKSITSARRVSIKLKSFANAWRAIPAIAPASSTPVAPAPTTTKLSVFFAGQIRFAFGEFKSKQNAPPNFERVFNVFSDRAHFPIRRVRNKNDARPRQRSNNRTKFPNRQLI